MRRKGRTQQAEAGAGPAEEGEEELFHPDTLLPTVQRSSAPQVQQPAPCSVCMSLSVYCHGALCMLLRVAQPPNKRMHAQFRPCTGLAADNGARAAGHGTGRRGGRCEQGDNPRIGRLDDRGGETALPPLDGKSRVPMNSLLSIFPRES